VDGDCAEEDPETVGMSQAAWESARRIANGDAVALLGKAGALPLAEAVMGKEQLLAVALAALRECSVQQKELGGAPEALRAAAERLAVEVGGAARAAEILGDTALLRSTLEGLLLALAGEASNDSAGEASDACAVDAQTGWSELVPTGYWREVLEAADVAKDGEPAQALAKARKEEWDQDVGVEEGSVVVAEAAYVAAEATSASASEAAEAVLDCRDEWYVILIRIVFVCRHTRQFFLYCLRLQNLKHLHT
jgi:hypothetical protein